MKILIFIDLTIMEITQVIINGCLLGDTKAQKHLYLNLLPYMKAIAFRYLKDPSFSKDVLQESFIKIFKKLENFDPQRASIKSWAAKIVINTSINYNHRIIGEPNLELEVEKHDVICLQSALENLSEEHILNLLKKMPRQWFEVFNLYIIDGYSHKEISLLLNIPVSLSRKRLSRGRDWVKKTFKDIEESEEKLLNNIVK